MQIRILGCLIEKETTTPDNYPLSTNALVNACNQSSNRHPVVAYDERTVSDTLLELRAEGMARTNISGRTNKHRHTLGEAWSLSPAQLAVIAVLFLRGPQTVGELRTRTARMHEFESLHAVEATLASLAERSQPLVEQLGREPGQKERRWRQLAGPESPAAAEGGYGARTGPGPGSVSARTTAPNAAASAAGDGETAVLRAEVARLRADVDRLYDLLGETPDAPS